MSDKDSYSFDRELEEIEKQKDALEFTLYTAAKNGSPLPVKEDVLYGEVTKSVIEYTTGDEEISEEIDEVHPPDTDRKMNEMYTAYSEKVDESEFLDEETGDIMDGLLEPRYTHTREGMYMNPRIHQIFTNPLDPIRTVSPAVETEFRLPYTVEEKIENRMEEGEIKLSEESLEDIEKIGEILPKYIEKDLDL